MRNKNCFQVSPLVLIPLLLAGNAAQAASIPCEVIINQSGVVYIAAGKGQDTQVNLQVRAQWGHSAGYQFGYVDGSVFLPIINEKGTKGNLTFQNGTLVDFAVRNKGADGIFGTTDDGLFRLSDASGYATQTYSRPIKRTRSNAGNPADYRKLTLQWDLNNDNINDLTVLLKSTTHGAGVHFVASATPVPVPVPAALWLLGSGITGLTAFLRRGKAR